MSEPYIGQIMIVGFDFAPIRWAQCNGQLIPIAQNTALFSLLGNTYGGDGVVTFGLPDMRSRIPIHMGQGPGLTNRPIGEADGEETHTLIVPEIPAHNHMVISSNLPANQQSPVGHILGAEPTGATAFYSDRPADSTMSPQMLSVTGGSLPHNNMQPFLTLNFCIALEGIYPARS